jgi:hypothetical protein
MMQLGVSSHKIEFHLMDRARGAEVEREPINIIGRAGAGPAQRRMEVVPSRVAILEEG